MNEIKEYRDKMFEDIKHIDELGNEYWEARELQVTLNYVQWRRFENTIDKAKIACRKSNINVDDHFADVGKMVDIGSNTIRKIQDYSKSRSDLNTYYNVGKELAEAGKHYGEGIIKKYSIKSSNDLNKTYSYRSLNYMVKYYEFQKVQSLTANLKRVCQFYLLIEKGAAMQHLLS